jgi:uncharacterized protein (DUF2147 family)
MPMFFVSRRAVASVLVTAALSATCAARAATPTTPVGEWQQFDDRKGDLRSVIRIDQVKDELVGTVVKSFPRPGEPADPKCDKCPGEFKDKPIAGLRILWGLKGTGKEWGGGRVLDPEDGKIYKVKVKLSDDGRTLEVRGYIGISLIGRSQYWTRVSP